MCFCIGVMFKHSRKFKEVKEFLSEKPTYIFVFGKDQPKTREGEFQLKMRFSLQDTKKNIGANLGSN
jgi:hypothetical protein